MKKIVLKGLTEDGKERPKECCSEGWRVPGPEKGSPENN